jgi:integrase/recombinase XerC
MPPKEQLEHYSFLKRAYLFLEELRFVQQKSKHTIRCYAADLNNFKEFLEKETFAVPLEERSPRIHMDLTEEARHIADDKLDLRLIKRPIIRLFLRSLNEKGASKRTIGRHISSLRSFFRFAVTQGAVEKNPMRHIEKPKPRNLAPTYLTYEQVKELLKQPNLDTYLGFRDRCMLELLYSSALRVGELVHLNKDDIDFGRMVISIHGKGDFNRKVPITDVAAKWLKNYLNHADRKQRKDRYQGESDPDAVFLNREGKRLSTRSVNRRFEKYLDVLGLKGKVSPHTIRHTIATHWLENGMEINTIKVLLGHKSFSTTTIYTRVTEKLKKDEYDRTFGPSN